MEGSTIRLLFGFVIILIITSSCMFQMYEQQKIIHSNLDTLKIINDKWYAHQIETQSSCNCSCDKSD